MSSEMRGCPFCGNQPRSGWQGTGVPGMDDCGYWGIDCCNAFAHADTEAEALAQWNRRALLARTEAGADLRGGNVRFDVRLKNVEAGADGAVAWILRTGHGTALHEGARPPVEGVGWRPLFDRPQDASGDVVLTGPGDHDDLPAFLEWVAGEVVRRDTRAGSFAVGLAQSLCGRAHILRIVKNDAMQAKEAK